MPRSRLVTQARLRWISCYANINIDRTPHAYPACSEADHAGSCLSKDKISLTYSELWQHLLDKGLKPGSYDSDSAIALFKRYGFYRLRGYWTMFEQDGRFLPGTTMDDVMRVESFDFETFLL